MQIKALLLIILFCIPVSAHITINFPESDVTKIGNAIWRNECGQKVTGLISWNVGEAWPSLGIGHFIWYPQGTHGIYQQSFDKLLLFLQKNKVVLPSWLITAARTGAPWPDRETFLAVRATDERIIQLQTIFESTITLQAHFIINQFKKQIHKLLAKHPAYTRLVNQLAQTPEGLFAMIDYSNCKGYGTNPQEQYNGQGWGLLQVLHAMDIKNKSDQVEAFIKAAQQVLENRVKNAPPERHEERWLLGWKNRINRYTNPW